MPFEGEVTPVRYVGCVCTRIRNGKLLHFLNCELHNKATCGICTSKFKADDSF